MCITCHCVLKRNEIGQFIEFNPNETNTEQSIEEHVEQNVGNSDCEHTYDYKLYCTLCGRTDVDEMEQELRDYDKIVWGEHTKVHALFCYCCRQVFAEEKPVEIEPYDLYDYPWRTAEEKPELTDKIEEFPSYDDYDSYDEDDENDY